MIAIIDTRWRKLAACAQFKIHNSKFIISPIHPLSSPYLPLKIWRILNFKLAKD